MRRHGEHRFARAALAGVVGGLAGAWAMNQYSAITKAAQRAWKNGNHQQPQEQKSSQQEQDDATMKTADRLAATFANRRLTKEEKQKAGPAIHYGYGAVAGGLYGALSALTPLVTTGAGTAYASALWLGGDELAVPALGLSRRPAEYPISAHVKGLGSHLIYGATLDLVRRGFQAVF